MADVINPWLNSGKTQAKMGSGSGRAASGRSWLTGIGCNIFSPVGENILRLISADSRRR